MAVTATKVCGSHSDRLGPSVTFGRDPATVSVWGGGLGVRATRVGGSHSDGLGRGVTFGRSPATVRVWVGGLGGALGGVVRWPQTSPVVCPTPTAFTMMPACVELAVSSAAVAMAM